VSAPTPIRGHLIVRLAPEAFLRALAVAGEGNPRYEAYVRGLWASLPTVAPRRYRGISRDPLQPIFETGVQTVPGVGPDWVAKVKMREGVHPGSSDPSYWRVLDPDAVVDVDFAREVVAQTDHPAEWEVVLVERDVPDVTADTLGFDVGYWGGDHYSLIQDAMLVPRWHAPDPDDFEALSDHARRLNEHQLFASFADADAYRSWYRTRPWAEGEFVEDGEAEFQVIRVDAVQEA
jgi:hypothetical protein